MERRMTHKRPARWYDAYIFDLDGTVYLGGQLLPRAGETLATLRANGKRTLFLSNNPTHTRAEYAQRLSALGVLTPPEDIVTSGVVMADFLRRELAPGARLFVIGERALNDTLREAGFELVDDAACDAVIASFDRGFDYRKLQIGFDALRAGVRFFATNPDKYCPVPAAEPGGAIGGQPDCAAIIAALEASTDRRCEAIVGKPARQTIDAILALTGVAAVDCVMTGDRLETDVAMGLNAGMAGALTLTGATRLETLASATIRPTYILRDLGDLIPE